jgi:hypothetical protein
LSSQDRKHSCSPRRSRWRMGSLERRGSNMCRRVNKRPLCDMGERDERQNRCLDRRAGGKANSGGSALKPSGKDFKSAQRMLSSQTGQLSGTNWEEERNRSGERRKWIRKTIGTDGEDEQCEFATLSGRNTPMCNLKSSIRE